MIGTELVKQLDSFETEPELNEEPNGEDVVTFDVPTMMRIMELCRESNPSDVQLHELLTNIITISKTKKVITMEDYDGIWNGIIEPKDAGVEKEYTDETPMEESLTVSKTLGILLGN